MLVAGSGVVVQRLTQPALRLLEGYWPSWLDPARDRLVLRAERRIVSEEAEWQRLAQTVLSTATPTGKSFRAFRSLDHRRRRRPSTPADLMPTALGNILRAAECRPAAKYGLDAVAVWPCLWLLLPDQARQELAAGRMALETSVGSMLWGALFLIFTPWAPLAAPAGLAVAIAAFLLWIPARAEVFADLLESAFDLYRGNLYRQLRWPLPTAPEDEPAEGRQLTSYLWRGSEAPAPIFVVATGPH
jgi:hypothetical protein